jgi:hypothetical protein
MPREPAVTGLSTRRRSPGQIAESADDIAEFDPDFVDPAVRHTPTRRLVGRREVASIVVDLCEPRYAGVTGAVIPSTAAGASPDSDGSGAKLDGWLTVTNGATAPHGGGRGGS